MSVVGSSKGSSKGSSPGQPTPSTTTNDTALVGEIDKNIKYKTIEPFTGERNKLQGFLLQLRLYVKFNGDRFRSETEQVLWAVTLLEGKAMNWIEGFLEDYLNCTNSRGEINEKKMEDTTIKIFQTWDGFLEEIKTNFGVMDEQKEAERAIESLRQKGSATAYTRDFQRYSTRTGWGDEALRYQYRKGLKDFVKDELLRTAHDTSTLENLIAAACEIDNAWYERSMERKGKYDPDYKRMGEGRYNKRQTGKNDYWPQPMEVDATSLGELSLQEKQRRQKERLCYNCGKSGHMARNCKPGKHFKNGKGRQGRNATLRGNSESMFACATMQEEPEQDGFVMIAQTLETVTLGSDDEEQTEDSATDSEQPDEISSEEYTRLSILGGTNTAEELYQAAVANYETCQNVIGVTYLDSPMEDEDKVRMHEKMIDLIATHRIDIGAIKWAVEEQITENRYANEIGVNRSQQYQDKLEANREYLPVLKAAWEHLLNLKIKEARKIAELRNQSDVTRIDHPEHGKLTWVACYTNACVIHQGAKENSGFWPHRRKPVYWTNKAEGSKPRTAKVEPQPSKN